MGTCHGDDWCIFKVHPSCANPRLEGYYCGWGIGERVVSSLWSPSLIRGKALKVLWFNSCVNCMGYRRPRPPLTIPRATGSVRDSIRHCITYCTPSHLTRNAIGPTIFSIWCIITTPPLSSQWVSLPISSCSVKNLTYLSISCWPDSRESVWLGGRASAWQERPLSLPLCQQGHPAATPLLSGSLLGPLQANTQTSTAFQGL